MVGIILDGFVLIGLMFLFDRKNQNRDFLDTGLVAFILTVAGALMNWLIAPYIGLLVLVLYFGLCIFLLWKLPEIALPRATVIGTVFVLFKLVEPVLLRAVLGGGS